MAEKLKTPAIGARAVGKRYGTLLLLRAIPAALLGIGIAFFADHSPTVGYFALAGFAITSGAIVLVGTAWLSAGSPRLLLVAQGVILLLGGIVSLLLWNGELSPLLFLSSVLFASSGLLELLAGLRSRGGPFAREWLFLGAISAVLALAIVLIPADFREVISIPGKDVPPLTASVILVGLIGAYCAIIAVYLVIAGLSLRGPQPEGTTTPTEAG